MIVLGRWSGAGGKFSESFCVQTEEEAAAIRDKWASEDARAFLEAEEQRRFEDTAGKIREAYRCWEMAGATSKYGLIQVGPPPTTTFHPYLPVFPLQAMRGFEP